MGENSCAFEIDVSLEESFKGSEIALDWGVVVLDNGGFRGILVDLSRFTYVWLVTLLLNTMLQQVRVIGKIPILS
jgi:hypothetical protein